MDTTILEYLQLRPVKPVSNPREDELCSKNPSLVPCQEDTILPPSEDEDEERTRDLLPNLSLREVKRSSGGSDTDEDSDILLDLDVDLTGGLVPGATAWLEIDSEGESRCSSEDEVLPRTSRQRACILTSIRSLMETSKRNLADEEPSDDDVLQTQFPLYRLPNVFLTQQPTRHWSQYAPIRRLASQPAASSARLRSYRILQDFPDVVMTDISGLLRTPTPERPPSSLSLDLEAELSRSQQHLGAGASATPCGSRSAAQPSDLSARLRSHALLRDFPDVVLSDDLTSRQGSTSETQPTTSSAPSRSSSPRCSSSGDPPPLYEHDYAVLDVQSVVELSEESSLTSEHIGDFTPDSLEANDGPCLSAGEDGVDVTSSDHVDDDQVGGATVFWSAGVRPQEEDHVADHKVPELMLNENADQEVPASAEEATRADPAELPEAPLSLPPEDHVSYSPWSCWSQSPARGEADLPPGMEWASSDLERTLSNIISLDSDKLELMLGNIIDNGFGMNSGGADNLAERDSSLPCASSTPRPSSEGVCRLSNPSSPVRGVDDLGTRPEASLVSLEQAVQDLGEALPTVQEGLFTDEEVRLHEGRNETTAPAPGSPVDIFSDDESPAPDCGLADMEIDGLHHNIENRVDRLEEQTGTERVSPGGTRLDICSNKNDSPEIFSGNQEALNHSPSAEGRSPPALCGEPWNLSESPRNLPAESDRSESCISPRENTDTVPVHEDSGGSSWSSPSRDLDALYLTQPSIARRPGGKCGQQKARRGWDEWYNQYKNVVAIGRERKRKLQNVESTCADKGKLLLYSKEFSVSHTPKKPDHEVPDPPPSAQTFNSRDETLLSNTSGASGAAALGQRRPLFQWSKVEPSLKETDPEYHQNTATTEKNRPMHSTPERRPTIRLGLSKRSRPPPLHKRLQWWVASTMRGLCSLQ